MPISLDNDPKLIEYIENEWSTLSKIVMTRTYARARDPENRTNGVETPYEVLVRVVRACNDQLGCGFTEKQQHEFLELMAKRKGIVAGRFLWQLGSAVVDQYGLLSLQNCAAVAIDDPVNNFTWLMDALMLGAGVGYTLENEHIDKIPAVQRATVTWLDDAHVGDADFIVPDSREGWVELLRRCIESHFAPSDDLHGRSRDFTFSTALVRPAGEPIRGFGGVASGPAMLRDGILEINAELNRYAGRKASSTVLLNVANIIGRIVVSGNVRRSAQIAIGSPDDTDFQLAKRWDLMQSSIRRFSNNSVQTSDYDVLSPEFWKGYDGKGEAYGIVNLAAARRQGRTGDTRYKDMRVIACNPCGEQPLENYETCCLAELFLPHCESEEELRTIARYLYIVCKHSLNLPCHWKQTEEVVHRNQRMGIGVTGIAESTKEQIGWLPDLYEYLRDFDRVYSERHGFNVSVKLTTVKPSGTLSLVGGVTAGWHPAHAPYYVKGMRISSSSPLVEMCREAGYRVYPRSDRTKALGSDTYEYTVDPTTMIIDFPITHGEDVPTMHTTTAITQLDEIAWLQRMWSDNAVSATVDYRPDELPAIKNYLKEHLKDIKAVSFMVRSSVVFWQQPLSSISKEQYENYVAQLRPISVDRMCSAETETTVDQIADENDECANGACPVR